MHVQGWAGKCLVHSEEHEIEGTPSFGGGQPGGLAALEVREEESGSLVKSCVGVVLSQVATFSSTWASSEFTLSRDPAMSLALGATLRGECSQLTHGKPGREPRAQSGSHRGEAAGRGVQPRPVAERSPAGSARPPSLIHPHGPSFLFCDFCFPSHSIFTGFIQ